MNCGQIQNNLVEDLSHRTDEAVQEHLRSCPICRRLCDELLELEELSRSLSGQFRVPPTFQSEVLERAVKTGPRIFRVRFALAALVLLVISLGLFRPWNRLDAEVRPEVSQDQGWTVSYPEVGEVPDSYFVEVVVDGQDDEKLILRLPSVIEIRRTDLQEDFYIRNVSH